MELVKLFSWSRSIGGMNGDRMRMKLPRSEKTPVYRRQTGSVYSVEFMGDSRLFQNFRRNEFRRAESSFLF